MRLAPQCSRAQVVGATALSGLALIGVAAMAMTGNGASDSEQMIANERAWAKSSVDGDADRMASFMADECIELAWEAATRTAPAHGSSTPKNQWVEAVGRRTVVYTSVDVRNLTVHLQGTRAVVSGEYSQTGTDNGKDISATGPYADTWLKRNGRWLLVHSVFP